MFIIVYVLTALSLPPFFDHTHFHHWWGPPPRCSALLKVCAQWSATGSASRKDTREEPRNNTDDWEETGRERGRKERIKTGLKIRAAAQARDPNFQHVAVEVDRGVVVLLLRFGRRKLHDGERLGLGFRAPSAAQSGAPGGTERDPVRARFDPAAATSLAGAAHGGAHLHAGAVQRGAWTHCFRFLSCCGSGSGSGSRTDTDTAGPELSERRGHGDELRQYGWVKQGFLYLLVCTLLYASEKVWNCSIRQTVV